MEKLKAVRDWARDHKALVLAAASFVAAALTEWLPGVPLAPLTGLVDFLLGT